MRRLSLLILGLGLIACAAAIFYISRSVQLFRQQQAETAEVILEQMQAVTKLVTAEGYFSEVYDYKDYYQWDISPLRKKALMRVKAKVIMGYDLEQMALHLDTESRTVTIRDVNRPQILALEHDVDYYDLTSGTFNKFAETDLNTLNQRAKQFISEVALQSNLVDLANTRKEEIFATLRTLTESAGYRLIIEPASEPVLRQ